MPNRASSIAVAALAAVLAVVAGGCVTTVELESRDEQAFAKLRETAKISSNRADRAFVFCVADAVTRALPPEYAEREWDIEVFDEEEVNAFAMTGGQIGVFSGLLKVTENQHQLAAVIGHEIAHVTEQHSLKRANRYAMTQVGASMVGMMTGTGQSGASLAGAMAQLGLSLPFDRGQETDADVEGLKFMAAAGFDPRQSVPLWQNMEKKSKSRPPQFLSTHPSPENRIGKLVSLFPETLKLYNEAQAAGRRPQCGR